MASHFLYIKQFPSLLNKHISFIKFILLYTLDKNIIFENSNLASIFLTHENKYVTNMFLCLLYGVFLEEKKSNNCTPLLFFNSFVIISNSQGRIFLVINFDFI